MNLAYLFSGQGSQYVGMHKIFIDYKSYSEKYFKISNELLGYNILDIIKNGPLEKINNTKHTQPSIFIISAIAYNIFKDKFNSPDCFAGHSLGEITALYCSEVLQFEEALILIKKRSENMEKASIENPGKMLAIINANKNIISKILKNTSITIANINSSTQIILSGTVTSVNDTMQYCKENQIKTLLLPVSGAFHSNLMQSASDALLETINQLNFKDAIIPIYQNYNALPTQDKDLIKDNLIQQITSPVQWEKTIKNMIKNKINKFIEIGPKNILTNLNRRIHSELEYNKSFEELINDKSI